MAFEFVVVVHKLLLHASVLGVNDLGSHSSHVSPVSITWYFQHVLEVQMLARWNVQPLLVKQLVVSPYVHTYKCDILILQELP